VSDRASAALVARLSQRQRRGEPAHLSATIVEVFIGCPPPMLERDAYRELRRDDDVLTAIEQ